MRAALIVILSLTLAGLQYRLWVADGGLSHSHQLRQQRDALLAQIDELTEGNRALQSEVDDLKAGLAATEERARQMLGLVRENETFFLVVRRDPD